MLIFQPHLQKIIIMKNWWPLHDLNYSKIIPWKAQSPYQHVILKPAHWPLISVF